MDDTIKVKFKVTRTTIEVGEIEFELPAAQLEHPGMARIKEITAYNLDANTMDRGEFKINHHLTRREHKVEAI